MAHITDIAFPSDARQLAGTLDEPDGPAWHTVLMLHGGGKTSTRSRYREWQDFLADQGIASLAVDFRGCGGSDGEFPEGSLANREKDALAAVRFLNTFSGITPGHVSVIAGSMGGHVAGMLTRHCPDLSSLVLFCAAAYGKPLETLPLGPEFTAAIRVPGSWQSTDLFSILDAYHHPVFVIYGSRDPVIPEEIRTLYRKRAEQNGEFHVIDGAGHSFLDREDTLTFPHRTTLYRLSLDFLRKMLPNSSGLADNRL